MGLGVGGEGQRERKRVSSRLHVQHDGWMDGWMVVWLVAGLVFPPPFKQCS